MNMIRAKIIVSWLLFLVFCLLLCLSWRHRILWLALYFSLGALIHFIKPRLPPASPMIRLLYGMTGFVFMFAFVVHGFLFPHSASLYLVMKILLALLVGPLVCCKACLDYGTFRSAP